MHALAGLPNHDALRSDISDLGLFESLVAVKDYEPIPIYGGFEYREQCLKDEQQPEEESGIKLFEFLFQ